MTIEEELNECLRATERTLRRSIRLSNANFRLFYSISQIAKSLEDNSITSFLVPYQLWLQSFLVELRNNVRYHREIRDNIAELIRARNEYELSLLIDQSESANTNSGSNSE